MVWNITRKDEHANVWYNKKINRLVAVERNTGNTPNLKFQVVSGKMNDYIDKSKHFETKQEALQYAKKLKSFWGN